MITLIAERRLHSKKPYPVIYVVANPGRDHKEVPRSTGHIMVTTRYSDQQGSKSRQKVMRLYKRWHRPITKRFIKPPSLHIESSLDRLGLLSPIHDQRSQQFFFLLFFFFFHLTYSRWTSSLPSCLWSQRIFPSLKSDKYVPTSFDQQFQVSQGHTSYKNKEN